MKSHIVSRSEIFLKYDVFGPLFESPYRGRMAIPEAGIFRFGSRR